MAHRSNANIYSTDMDDISAWTDGDGGTGVSSQVTFGGKSCMSLATGAGIGEAKRTLDVGAFGSRTVFSFSSYFDALGSYILDYFVFTADNGVNKLNMWFFADGLYYHHKVSSVHEIGTDLVVLDTWQEWTFDVNWTTATCDVYLGGVLQQSGVSCDDDATLADGNVVCHQKGFWDPKNKITYIDWLKVGGGFYLDKGLRLRCGSDTVAIGVESLDGHKLRVFDGTDTWGIYLVDPGTVDDSGIRIYDGSATKGLPLITV